MARKKTDARKDKVKTDKRNDHGRYVKCPRCGRNLSGWQDSDGVISACRNCEEGG